MEETEENVEPELRPDVLERNWNQLMALHQERDAAIHSEKRDLRVSNSLNAELAAVEEAIKTMFADVHIHSQWRDPCWTC